MCTRRYEELRKKIRFEFVFKPVHVIDCTDTARQPIPKMRPSHRKGTIAISKVTLRVPLAKSRF